MNKKLIFNIECLEINLNDIRAKDQIASLITSDIPFKIKRLDEKFKLISDYNDNIKILQKLFSDNKIKISASMNNSFSGNTIEHSQIEMTLEDYFNYKGEINLYLSQINLLNSENLKTIINYNYLEELIRKDFSKINIWHSFKSTLSKFHFDVYDNLLYIVKGKKIISLVPNNSKFIIPSKIGNGNQCERIIFKKSNKRIADLKEFYYTLQKEFMGVDLIENNFSVFLSNYKELFSKILNFFIIQIELKENEILFIPEGWWHQVQTEGVDNLAFNFWWEKTNQLILNGKENFLIKQSLISLIEKRIKKIYIKLRNVREYRKYKLSSLKKIIEKRNEKYLIDIIFKDDSNCHKFLFMYSEFEEIKDENEDHISFMDNFWRILKLHNCAELFFCKINEFKHNLGLQILDELKTLL